MYTVKASWALHVTIFLSGSLNFIYFEGNIVLGMLLLFNVRFIKLILYQIFIGARSV